MPKYYDADALKKRMLDYFSPPEAFDVADLRPSWAIQDGIEDIFATFPTADVVEVKHGEWISLHNGYYKCSCCGTYWKLVGTPELNGMYYCLNCGAKMQLDEEDIL